MYLVFFGKSHVNRYDDPVEMAEAIAAFLGLHPHATVKIVKYV